MRCFGVNIRVLMLTVSVIVFESLTVSGFVHSNSVGHSTAACNLLSTSSNNAILPRKCNSNYACNSYRHSYGYSCSNSYSYRYSRAVCRESLSLNVHKNNDEMDVVNKAINNSSSNLLRDYLIAFLAIPLASQLLPSLLSKVTDFSVAATDRQYYIIGLLLAKRVYLYSLAAVTVAITAKRSVGLSTQLGKVKLSTTRTAVLYCNPILSIFHCNCYRKCIVAVTIFLLEI